MRWLLMTLLLTLAPAGLRAAVFDFTPNSGIVTATYVGGASGNVQMSISGQYPISVPTGNTQPPLINNGVVAWASSSTVYYYTFDPVKTNWSGQSVAASSVQDLKVVDGIVGWSVTSGGTLGAFMRAYDPLRRSWRDATEAGTILSPGVMNQGGVVAGIRQNPSGSLTVFHYAYDPLHTGWVRSSTDISLPSTTIANLTVADGLVGWSYDLQNGQHRANYRVYDPQGAGGWKSGQSDGGFVTEFAIANSQVTWKAGDTLRFAAYNGAGGWGVLPVVVPLFAVSTNVGNAAFNVVFIDMSLGANSWSWNFGDASNTSSRRSPVHSYVNSGRFNATLTVANTALGGAGNTTQTILTDTILPTGTLKINGTTSGGFTTNRNVTLALTVQDNSLNGLALRVSNEGTNWSDWLSFNSGTTNATVNWALPTNIGTRSVSAQFRDGALNTSTPPVTASIQLDTTPPPVVTLVNTNFDEAAGNVELVVLLDHTYSQPVVLNYAASNGTAVAGSDFTMQPGTLTFAPGIRSRPIPVSIANDGNVELNETFSVQLTVVSNATLGSVGTVTILDNDPALVSFAQTNYTVFEDDTNGAVAVVLRLSAPSGRPVTVVYAATNGTATPNLDFSPVSGFLIIPPGQTERFFAIQIADDVADEYPETINLQILSVTNAIVQGSMQATATIIDDDLPLVSFLQGVFPALEPTNGNLSLRFDVRLSKPFTEAAEVEVAVDGITATPEADYDQPDSNIRLVFNPGQTNKQITITLFVDSVREPQETIRLTLTDLYRASPGAFPTADIVITDDDAPPFMSGPVVSTNGQFTATFTGYPGQVFAVECSPNFINWTQIVRLTNTTGTLVFSQAFSTNALGQFYRTRLIP